MKKDWKQIDSQDLMPASLLERIEELQRQAGDSALRRFAIWAASQVIDDPGCGSSILKEASEYVNATNSDSILLKRWAGLKGAMAANCCIGLRHNPQYAYSQFAAYHTLDPDPVSSAIKSAGYARRSIRSGVVKGSRLEGYPDWLDQIGADAWALGLQIDEIDKRIEDAGSDPHKVEKGE